jgi:hypothetical protein
MGFHRLNPSKDIQSMGDSSLIAKIQQLTDLELALLVSLVAGQHCLIEVEHEALNQLQQEIQLVGSKAQSLLMTY